MDSTKKKDPNQIYENDNVYDVLTDALGGINSS